MSATPVWTSEQESLIRRMWGGDATPDEMQLFLYTCARTGLDPLARQIYMVKRSGRMSIQTGIDGYRLIADRTGKLGGISDYMFDSEEGKTPKKATVTVKKLLDGGILADFTATARWSEYQAGGPMWAKMPYLMLGKCAEALALRKAFPADLNGVCTTEEMAQADNVQQEATVTAEVAKQKAAFTPTPGAAEMKIEEVVTGSYVPPELEWSYQKTTGVLICRIVEASKVAKKKGGGFVVTIRVNGKIDETEVLGYYHHTHHDLLLKSIGKIAKFEVKQSGKFVTIETVLAIDGQPVPPPTPVPSDETQARLLASVIDMTGAELVAFHAKMPYGSWSETLRMLQQRQAELEALE